MHAGVRQRCQHTHIWNDGDVAAPPLRHRPDAIEVVGPEFRGWAGSRR